MDVANLTAFLQDIDWHAVAVLAVAGLTFWLFASERLPVQTTALLCLLALMLVFGLVPYYEAEGKPLGPEAFLAGFGHPALVTICCLMVLGRGLVATGALEPAARFLARAWNITPQFAFLGMLVFCLAVSGVMNDTPVVVLMMPVLLSVAARTGTHASTTLLPMNYAVIIGGMATTIGTSTNLLVVGLAADLGVPLFGVFDFVHIVAIAAAIALPYLWLVLPRLLPRAEGRRESAPLVFDAVLEVRHGGWAEGRQLREVLARVRKARVLRVLRNGGDVVRLPTLLLRGGDQLLVADAPGELRELAATLGARLRVIEPRDPGDPATQILAQVLLTHESEFTGTPTGLARFVDERQLGVVGLHRPQREEGLDPLTASLKPGDVLLVQGTRERLEAIKGAAGVLVLDATLALPHTRKAPIALLIMAGVLFLAATKLLPMVLAAALGVAVMMLSGCLRWQEATDALASNVIMIVVASLALGVALTETGIMQAAGDGLAWLGAWVDPVVMIAAIMLMMAIVTNFVSNNAAAIIGTPVAVIMANALGVDPRPFVLAVLFGCNLCFATPMGYQTNLLVMSAAGYRFNDFVRGGLPLLLLLWVTLTWLLAREYGLL
jgi:di/tricarboxylate transporter